ncbi:hypothetical protein [Endozoicomonas sp. ALC066]|uniref:hypothetical protein n=1 Tax=Endozoicomonas sp. ALC066 TaxID=3403078 RepID=UPI003BB74659
MNNKIMPYILALTVSLLMTGCESGGGSDDSVSEPPPSTDQNDLIGNTDKAVSFTLIKNPASACEAPAKLTLSETDSTYKAEPIFVERGSDVSCQNITVTTMKDHLILEGYYYNFENDNGQIIENCRLVSLPLNSTDAWPTCIAESQYMGRVFDINVSQDGELLTITHDVEKSDTVADDSTYEAAISTWDGSVLNKIQSIPYTEKTDSDHLHAWMNNKNFVVYEESFMQGQFRDLQLKKSMVDGVAVNPEMINEYYGRIGWFEPTRFGDYLIHNWRYDADGTGYPEIGQKEVHNYVFNLTTGETEQLRKINDPFGEGNSLANIWAIRTVSPDQSIFYADYDEDQLIVGEGFVSIDHNTLNVSLLHDMSDLRSEDFGLFGNPPTHNLGDNHVTYVMAGGNINAITAIYGFDMVNQRPLNNGDSLLGGELQDFVVSEYSYYPGGLKIKGEQYGEPKELYFNQITQLWSDKVVDSTEIEQPVPLFPVFPG